MKTQKETFVCVDFRDQVTFEDDSLGFLSSHEPAGLFETGYGFAREDDTDEDKDKDKELNFIYCDGSRALSDRDLELPYRELVGRIRPKPDPRSPVARFRR